MKVKKLFIYIALLLISIILVACKNPNLLLEEAYDNLTYEVILNNNSSKDNIINDLNLIRSDGDVRIRWVSSNLDVIKRNGKVFRPESDENITLTAILSNSGDVLEKDFEVTVIKKEVLPEPTFNVFFDLGYDNLELETITVEKNNKVDRPNNPTREGYRFIGWLLNGVDFDFETLINKDITLLARWDEIIYYEVTFNFGYEDGPNNIVETVELDHKIEEPITPNREGFDFLGWFIDDELFDFNTLVNNNLTLVAKWEERVVLVTFDLGYNDLANAKSIKENTKVDQPINPTRRGYRFLGWFVDEVEFDFETLINIDITIIAKWEIVTYDITYVLNGATNHEDNITSFTVETSFILKEPTYEDYEFVGWFDGNDMEVSAINNRTGNLVLTAKFYLPETSILVFNTKDNVYVVDEILNRTITTTNNNGTQILFEKDSPVQIYNKEGYDSIVKGWNDVFYSDTVFIVIKDGLVVEGFRREGNKVLNSNNQDPLLTTTSGGTEYLGKWKNLTMTEDSYLVIAQKQAGVMDQTYFNELASLSYLDNYERFETILKDDLVTYVIRDGKYLLNQYGQKIELPAFEQKEEVRAVWVATVSNIDLPRMSSETQYKAAIRAVLDRIASLNFNTVFFQIRPMNDAFYDSDLAPWSMYITGTQGVDPGFDVLGFIINEAHSRGLELHGWLNPYRVANSNSGWNSMHDENFAKQKPHLTIRHNEQRILNPGEPEVQTYVQDVINELIERYPTINGVHFDDYFYLDSANIGTNTNSPDYDTYLTYRDNPSQSFTQFRRDSVTKVIRGIFNNVEAFNQNNGTNIKFGISPSGIWDNYPSNPSGSHTAGWSHLQALNADTKAWIEEEILHYILPQLYWPFDKFSASGNPVAPFANLVSWWNDVVSGTSVDLLIGIGFYRQNGSDWLYYNELLEELRFIQQFDGVAGSSIYTYHTLQLNNADIQRSVKMLKEEFWTIKVNTGW